MEPLPRTRAILGDAGARPPLTEQELILVDEDDVALGRASRDDCHAGQGRLHRAFSAYLFDADGRLLLQRRQRGKELWPGYWSNSCCSHPRWGEALLDAASRRLREELGVASRLEPLFKYRYQARYRDVGAEHELCWVLAGRVDPAAVQPNPDEVQDVRFATPGELDATIDAAEFTPWFRIAWRRLRADHRDELERICARDAPA